MDVADGGFDTGVGGTSEQAWRALLESAPLLRETRSPLLIVAPHPDDETLGAGGLQQRYPAAQLIVVTDGEKARRDDPALARHRRRELTAAQRCLGRHGNTPTFLALPDGAVCAYEQQLERVLTVRLRGISTLVAPFERDGHADHDVIGRVCMRLARRYRIRLLRYLIWAWHQRDVGDFRPAQFVRLALTDRERQVKERAISCFRSQLEGGPAAVVPSHVLAYFRRPYEAFLQ
jgi:LmbE family N-acetylglucosaminyl deacetylase